jgi:phosphoserine phosphatase
LLAGLPKSRLAEVLRSIPLAGGAERLIQTLKVLGYKTAVLSGGFTFFGRHLQDRLGIDYVFANELETANGAVTGQVVGEIVDGKKKAELLKMLAEKENISVDQVVAVGDGANDLPMLNLAGMGIAFHAKPLVRQSASHSVSHLGLDALLYLIGVRDRDLEGTQFRTSAADA